MNERLNEEKQLNKQIKQVQKYMNPIIFLLSLFKNRFGHIFLAELAHV